MVFFPLRVYHHTCLGILFASSSIRGRGTTVFCVDDLSDEKARLALKMSWQDLERIDDQARVTKRLVDNSHPNVIVPIKMFDADRKGQTCTTLGAIRGFLDEQIHRVNVENRVLSVSVSELKRPVKYFWGVHDFVRGLRGALLGHEFLTSIGILHRDISENNIVLGLYPWQERGYLIDFDMAILQSSSTRYVGRLPEQKPTQPRWPGETKHVKGIRTGTFPYISFNVLMGQTHTHFDDVESFFYVLLLFFFSYAGPLPQTELQNAQENGFVRPIGSGRLPHMRSWPKKYADWAYGEAETIAAMKGFDILSPNGSKYLNDSAELRDCLNNNWPEDLHDPIRALLWETLTAFGEATRRTGPGGVSHARFISILDEWLVTHAELEHEYSNCPDFKDSKLG
ncbi:kinase-like domain-containing protein [Boletus edulis]|nr:kinase-like domain-containing protein [Boletus edulis]